MSEDNKVLTDSEFRSMAQDFEQLLQKKPTISNGGMDENNMLFWLPALEKIANNNCNTVAPKTDRILFDWDADDIFETYLRPEDDNLRIKCQDSIDSNLNPIIPFDKFVRTAFRSFKHMGRCDKFYAYSAGLDLQEAFEELLFMQYAFSALQPMFETIRDGLFVREKLIPVAYLPGIIRQFEPMPLEYRVFYNKDGVVKVMRYYTPDTFVSDKYRDSAETVYNYYNLEQEIAETINFIVPDGSKNDLWVIDVMPTVDGKLALIDMCVGTDSAHYKFL